MDSIQIRFRVQLVLRLINTVTSLPVVNSGVFFEKNQNPYTMIRKSDGFYISMEEDKDNFWLTVKTPGYEKQTVYVDYEAMNSSPPILEVYLIPLRSWGGIEYFSLEGNLKGMQSLEGVNLGKANWFTGEYEQRKKILNVINLHKMPMNQIHYGLIHAGDPLDYENLEVEKEISMERIKVLGGISNPFEGNSPISRIIYGQVDEAGNYIFRVEESSKDESYLLKYLVNDEVRFQKVDFPNEPGKRLE